MDDEPEEPDEPDELDELDDELPCGQWPPGMDPPADPDGAVLDDPDGAVVDELDGVVDEVDASVPAMSGAGVSDVLDDAAGAAPLLAAAGPLSANARAPAPATRPPETARTPRTCLGRMFTVCFSLVRVVGDSTVARRSLPAL